MNKLLIMAVVALALMTTIGLVIGNASITNDTAQNITKTKSCGCSSIGTPGSCSSTCNCGCQSGGSCSCSKGSGSSCGLK